jgi:hypothetical protein
MSTESPEVGLGDPGVAKPRGRTRWTIGRVATDLAIILVAVPLIVGALDSAPGGGCGMTGADILLPIGLLFLGIRGAWLFGKVINDAGERWLNLPNSPMARAKPQPPDDF